MSGLDSFPKKPCKYCKQLGHFPYMCRQSPKNIKARAEPIKRTAIKKIGKRTQQWLDARQEWIALNPPPIQNKYWLCYLRIHPWCPGRIDLEHLTLDHVVSRSSDPKLRLDHANLKPACEYCNNQKGSRSLEAARGDAV